MALMPRSFFLSAGVGLVAALSMVAAIAGPGVTRSGEAASTVTQISSGDKVDVRKRARDVSVDAPSTHVEAGRRVRVDAPYAGVDVNTDRRRVRVQAPFADVDVRW